MQRCVAAGKNGEKTFRKSFKALRNQGLSPIAARHVWMYYLGSAQNKSSSPTPADRAHRPFGTAESAGPRPCGRPRVAHGVAAGIWRSARGSRGPCALFLGARRCVRSLSLFRAEPPRLGASTPTLQYTVRTFQPQVHPTAPCPGGTLGVLGFWPQACWPVCAFSRPPAW